MAKTIGRTTNTNDTATQVGTPYTLGASTSTTIASADTKRIYFAVSNLDKQEVWIKFQAASVDDALQGIFLNKDSFYEMPVDSIYTGEICAIPTGGASDVKLYVTEY